MKDYIIAFLICLACTCWINGSYPPQPYPAGVNDLKQGTLGLKRDEGMIPEVNITSGSRPTGLITDVDDKSGNRDGMQFPLNANN